MADKPDKPGHSHEGLEIGTFISLIGLFVLATITIADGCDTVDRLDRIENHINLCPLKTEGFLEEQGLTCDDLIRQGEDNVRR